MFDGVGNGVLLSVDSQRPEALRTVQEADQQ
jgi:hypothetical protein